MTNNTKTTTKPTYNEWFSRPDWKSTLEWHVFSTSRVSPPTDRHVLVWINEILPSFAQAFYDEKEGVFYEGLDGEEVLENVAAWAELPEVNDEWFCFKD